MRIRVTAVLALGLSLVLQLAPFCRQLFVNLGTASSPLGIIFRWTAGAGTLLGANHAVSGASGIVITSPPAKTNKTGGKLSFRITISSLEAYSYWATMTPPGPPDGFEVTMPQNVMLVDPNNGFGNNGYLTNSTPVISTPPGVYTIYLYAYEGTFQRGSRTPAFIFTWTVTGTNPAPQITAQPTNQVAGAGSNATFGMTANGLADFYQWRLNGNDLSSGTNPLLFLTNVSGADAGTYSVIVSNTFGTVISSNVTLTVTGLSPPSVTTAPGNLTVLEGSDASIVAAATGSAALSYQWRKNGSPLGGQTATNFTLSSVTTNDAASYTVVVNNFSGAVTSTPPVSLAVVALPQLTLSNAPPNQVSAWLNQYPGATYAVDFRNSFAETNWELWSNLPAVATTSNVLLSAPITNNAQFYRVRLSIP